MSFIPEAIASIAPYGECYLEGTDITNLVWLDENIERPTDAAILAEAARLEALAPTLPKQMRNTRLLDSDWTQLPDLDLTTAEVKAWATYRQALRALDVSGNDPAAVDWPTPPNA